MLHGFRKTITAKYMDYFYDYFLITLFTLHFRVFHLFIFVCLFCLDFLPSISFCVSQRNENNTRLTFWSELFIYCSLLLSFFLYHVFVNFWDWFWIMQILEWCSLSFAHKMSFIQIALAWRRSALFLVLLVTRLYNVPSLVYPQLKLCEAASRSFLPAARGLLPPQQPCVVLSPATGEHHDGEHAHTNPSYTGHSPGL